MSEFDQDRAKLDAGSAPLPEKEEALNPRKPDYIPKPDDDPIVKEAYREKQHDLHEQVTRVQTQGEQKGFTKASVEGVLEAREDNKDEA